MRPVFLFSLLVFGFATPAYAQQLKEITNSIGLKLILIPAGSFTMGSPAEEKGRSEDELQHQVTISNSYYLGVLEVTQGQFEKVMGKIDHILEDEKLPVGNVEWAEAVLFCEILSELPDEKAQGRKYRLPTEAEWEYACRAGTKTSHFFGNSIQGIEEYAWTGENSKGGSRPGGEKRSNQWGLFDMYGNVSEWCHDWYGKYAVGETTDPTGAVFGAKRVLRGSSRRYVSSNCRSAARGQSDPEKCGEDTGFRVAMSMPAKQPAPASLK